MYCNEICSQQPAEYAAISTKFLLQAVPITAEIGFKYLEVKKGYCKAILPLSKKSTNQHGTHQGLVLGVAADYTGGLALSSLLPNEPVVGIHNIEAERYMCLWLTKQQIEYMRPSTQDVFLEAEIAEPMHADIEQQYYSGATILLDINIRLFNPQNKTVAKAVLNYYCKMKAATQQIAGAAKAVAA
jgi:acyl-coenzyme A thioesterase PaaI-like protein